jgi:hypothetical protein
MGVFARISAELAQPGPDGETIMIDSKHGVQGRRQWRKVHLAMDTATSDIRAVEFTPSREGDSPVLPDLLGQIPEDEDIGTVTADGAYDPGLRLFRAELIHWINSGTPSPPPLP